MSVHATRLAVCALLLSVAGMAHADDPRRARAFMGRGIKAMDDGELNKAEELFLKARQADSRLPEPEMLLGQVAMAQARYEAAEEHFLHAIELSTALPDLLARERNIRDRELDLDNMERGAGAQPKGTNALKAESDTERLRQEIHRSEREKWELVQDNVPADYYMYLGNARMGGGRPADAATAYREAAHRAPDAPEPLHNLAVALLQSGQAQEALDACRQASEKDYAPAKELCPRIEEQVATAGQGGGPG